MNDDIDRSVVARVPALEAYFAARGDVLLAYLYGSQARGTAGPLSDVDVAVLLTGAPGARECLQARLDVIAAVTDILARDDVDVAVLNEAPPALAFRVIHDGVLLHAQSAAIRVDYVARITIEYLDLQPCLALYERAVLERARRGEMLYGPNPYRGALERYLRIAESADDAEAHDDASAHGALEKGGP